MIRIAVRTAGAVQAPALRKSETGKEPKKGGPVTGAALFCSFSLG